MSDAVILTELRGPIGLLTINRPKTLNALDVPTCSSSRRPSSRSRTTLPCG